MSRWWWPVASFVFMLSAAMDTASAPEIVYASIEAEVADEYRVGWNSFGPGFLRLIGRAEIDLSENLTAKAMISPCGGPYRKNPEGITQCAVYRLIEELTLNGVYRNFDFSLGRQIVTQGNTEGFILLDRYNGHDFCRFARLDVQHKLPNWLGRGRVFFDSSTLTVTFAPLSGRSRLPAQNSYCADEFNDPGRFENLGDPSNDNIEDWAGGAEWAINQDRWNATLNFMSTREDIFVVQTFPAPEKIRPRTTWIGGTASTTLGPVVLRTEVAFSPDRMFTLDPAVTFGRVLNGIPTNGVDERWNLLASVGVEGRNFDWLWSVQYFHDRVQTGPALVRDGEAHLMSLRLRRSFRNDRLQFDGFSVFDLDYLDLGIRTALSYEIDEATRVEAGATVYADFGDRTGFLGSYADRESLYLKLKRTLF